MCLLQFSLIVSRLYIFGPPLGDSFLGLCLISKVQRYLVGFVYKKASGHIFLSGTN